LNTFETSYFLNSRCPSFILNIDEHSSSLKSVKAKDNKECVSKFF